MKRKSVEMMILEKKNCKTNDNYEQGNVKKDNSEKEQSGKGKLWKGGI